MSKGKIFGLFYLSVSLIKFSSYYYDVSSLSHEYCILYKVTRRETDALYEYETMHRANKSFHFA